MKINLIKTLSGWSPSDESATKYHHKFKLGDIYHMDVTRYKDQRNAKLLAKYWVMVGVVLDNQEKYRTKDQLHIVIKRCLGVVEEIYNPITNSIDIDTGSVSFSKMDEAIFQQFYKDALTFCCRYVITGASPDEVEARVNQLIPFM